ncbi:MAG: CotH kinase family protein, partial [Sphingobacteriaceae bacterium]|nr:CotH kinase family protein [Cytophagaceae bacterium]
PLFQVEYPKLEDITNEQFAYIKSYVDAFEAAIYGPDYRDPTKGFRAFIDEDSFVDYFLLTELTRNVDGYRLSAFFSKNRDSKGGKLMMGPAWDYNIAFGNGDYYDGWKPEGWQYQVNDGMLPLKTGQQYEDGYKAPAWWERLLSDPAFARKATQRWKTLRADGWSDTRVNRFVDSCATQLGESQTRNFERWKILGTYVWPNYYVGKTHAEEVTWMKDWLRKRLAWLDEQVNRGYLVTGTEPVLAGNSLQLWPNPTEGGSRVRYELARPGFLRLSVYDGTGRRVQTLAEGQHQAGRHELDWVNTGLAPGLYMLELQAEGERAVRRKVLKW